MERFNIKLLLFALILLLNQYVLSAQSRYLFHETSTQKNKVVKKWKQKNKIGLQITEVAFVNWNAGGNNSISALLNGEANLDYRNKSTRWDNKLFVRYGVNKQQEKSIKKTDDLLELVSNFGYEKNPFSNWYYSTRFNFKTQFRDGFKYPDRSKPISKFMAPAYIFLGSGVEYGKKIDEFSFYMSPLTFKSTLVLDDDLANAGNFGVTPAQLDANGEVRIPGEKVRKELGILLTNTFEKIILKNVKLRNALSLYSDYLNGFGNVDVDWEVLLDFKVNTFINATLGTHLKYDDDVKTKRIIDENNYVEEGPKTQLKQLLGVGVVLDF